MTVDDPTPSAYAAPEAYSAGPSKPPAGAVAWGMGFLAFIPIPVVGSLVTAVVMMAVGNGQKGKGELARRNGVAAANWGFTYLAATIVLVGGAVLTLVLSTGGAGGPVPQWASATAFTLLAVWLFPLQIAHLVVTIMGVVKASSGTVFANRVALPLLR